MNIVPEEIKQSVLCYSLCDDSEESDEEDNSASVAVCNNEGYLLELRNKKIVNSCCIRIKDASKISIYYQYNDRDCNLYYLIQNDSGVLIIVKKWKKMLLVVKQLKNVKECRIFDYKSKGYPQIGIYHMDSEDMTITTLSEFENIDLDTDSYFALSEKALKDFENPNALSSLYDDDKDASRISDVSMEVDDMNNIDDNNTYGPKKEGNIQNEYLLKKLQGMKHFQNELNYEISNLKTMFMRLVTLDANTSSNNGVSSKFSNNSIRITKVWSKLHLSYWIIGVEFWMLGIMDVRNIRLFVRGSEVFDRYTYRVFDASNKPTKDERKGIAVVALNVPDFETCGRYNVRLTLAHDNAQTHTDTLHLTPEDMLRDTYQIFRRQSDNEAMCEDLLATLVVRRVTNLLIEVRHDLDGVTPEDVLGRGLGFTRVHLLGENYYVMESGALAGTSVSVQKLLADVATWRLTVASRDMSDLRILVRALRNELPSPVRFRLDSDMTTGGINI